MGKLLLVASICMILSCKLNTCTALECYKCNYALLESDNSGINWFFNTLMNIFSDAHCQLREGSDDINSTVIEDCPVPEPGNVSMCYAVMGEIMSNTVIPGLHSPVNLTMYTVSRGCFEINETHQEEYFAEGCHKEFPEEMQEQVKENIKDVSMSNMTLEGEACYSTHSLVNDQYFHLNSAARDVVHLFAVLFCIAFVTYWNVL